MNSRRSRPRPWSVLLLLWSVASPVRADGDGFALVLGGGGARGLAHIGVIEALEELGLRPSFVCGTSMGAVIGALYACGYDSKALRELVEDRSWLQTLLDARRGAEPIQGGWWGLPPHQLRLRLDIWPPLPPAGVSFGQSIEGLLGRLTADALFVAGGDFDRLPIAFRCVSTDVVSGEAVVFERGALPRVVRASGALPLVFVPVEYEGRSLLDGGLVDNLPLELARERGYTRALVVDVSNTFLPETEPPGDLVSLFERATRISQRDKNSAQTGPDDVLLQLDARFMSVLSFGQAAQIIEVGRRATLERAAALRAWPGASALEPHRPIRRGPVFVSQVEVRGNRRLSDWSVRKRMGLAPGDEVELEDLWRRAERLARQSAFENVWIEVEALADSTAAVTIHVVERDRPELELAANYRDREGPAALVRLRLDNRLGAGSERALGWRVGEELSALRLETSVPVRGSQRMDAQLGGQLLRERVELYRASEAVDALVVRSASARLGLLVAAPSGPAALRFSLRAVSGRTYLESRRPQGRGEFEWRSVALGVQTRDSGGLGGWSAEGWHAEMEWGTRAFGGDRAALLLQAGAIERLRLGARTSVGLSVGLAATSRPVPDALLPRAGGPWGWVGMERDEVVARQLAWLRLGWEFELNPALRVEAATAAGWSSPDALEDLRPRPGAQVQVVLETAVGPVRTGVSAVHRGDPLAFFEIGHEF